ncbi:hypothetical protein MMAD_21600 [Mycolicibacterium madagascariense]|uniref:Helix-turn-helix domain-containing protein n=1 Tax=Mycolicibacterium madagascariense TaxID=212765 RepID=A0A7I7XFA7_9MYCO|nr:hypothetical protein MMAD_21600 [Mycolicibacterium madagascariense]
MAKDVPAIIRWDQAYNRNGNPKLPRAVVNAIRTYVDNDTLAGWVSQETLAQDTGLDESNVRRQLRKNEDVGWLVSKRGRAGRASEYRLTYPQPGADARLDTTPTVQIRTVRDQDPNRAQMPGYTPQPCTDARLLPGADARPTTPRTSPQEKFCSSDASRDDPWAQPTGDPFADEGERLDAREGRAVVWAADGLPDSEWPPKRPPSRNLPRAFGDRME